MRSVYRSPLLLVPCDCVKGIVRALVSSQNGSVFVSGKPQILESKCLPTPFRELVAGMHPLFSVLICVGWEDPKYI